MKEKMTNTSIL